MNTDCFHRHKSRKIVIVVVSFLVVYVLSTGLAMKLEDSGFISQRANTILYAPLIPLAAIPGVRSFMDWYIFHVWHADTMGDNTI